MSKIVKVGIVGAGHRGGSFVDELLKIPDCKLTALCDVSEENLGLFDRRWHRSDTLKTTDLQRMLAGDLVDAVIITVPDRWHREVAEACFAAGKAANNGATCVNCIGWIWMTRWRCGGGGSVSPGARCLRKSSRSAWNLGVSHPASLMGAS